MKQNEYMSYIVSFVMILYPPLIYFLMFINIDFSTSFSEWIIASIVDLMLVVITTIIINHYTLKSLKRKLNNDEKSHLLFSYISNGLMFLYVYQFLMGIDQAVSIFTLSLIAILSYKFLISNSIIFKELFIISFAFGLFDLLLISFTGNTILDQINPLSDVQGSLFQIGFMFFFLTSLGYYIYRLTNKHSWNLIRYLLIISILAGILFVYVLNSQEELIATIFVFSFFLFLIDLIMRIVTKNFMVADLAYYLRIILVTSLLLIAYEIELFLFHKFDVDQMAFFIAIFYVSAFSEIITVISPKQETTDLLLNAHEYLNFYYRKILSRYKDITLLTDLDEPYIQIERLGRSVLTSVSLESSLIIIQSDDKTFIDESLKHISHHNICVLTHTKLDINYSNLFITNTLRIYSNNQKNI
jgi:hypothetical protein